MPAVLQPPALGELLPRRHDRRRGHVGVVEIQVGHVGHAVDTGRDRWRQRGGFRDDDIFHCANFGVRRDTAWVDLQIVFHQLCEDAAALERQQGPVQLDAQVGAFGDGDGELLLVKVVAYQVQFVAILAQGRRSRLLAHQREIQRAVAQVADHRAGARIGEQCFLWNIATVHQVLLRPTLEGGAALHAHRRAGQIRGRADRAGEGCARQRRGLAQIVDVCEIHHRLPFRRNRDGGDGSVNIAQAQGVEQTVEGIVLEFDVHAQFIAQGFGQGDVEAIQFELAVVELKGRVVGGRAQDQFASRLDLLPVVGRRNGRLLLGAVQPAGSWAPLPSSQRRMQTKGAR